MTVKMNELGELIREHRKRAGLTQVALADLAGIGKATVFDIEKGKDTVRVVNLLKVLKALNISLHFESPLIDREKTS
jgi:y4mF family transcriptional regulator